MIRFGIVEIEDEAAIVYQNTSPCQLMVNNGSFEAGTLVLTKNEICWKRGDTQNGFMISWEKVTVQAITQEPQRCVYFMIDMSWPENNANGGANGNHQGEEEIEDDEGNVSEGSAHEVTEFHLIFQDPEEVDNVYYTMTKYPEHEPGSGSSDDDDFFDGEMEQMNLGDDERFADAD